MTDAPIPLRRDRAPIPVQPETVAERVQRLQREARALAGDHVQTLADMLADLQAEARAIADGGAAYSEGARAIARSIAQDCESRALTLAQIRGKS